ncbi:MAG: type 4a pilus biogenesis protein PilO [Rhodocyclaceae bacterium]|jgi:type IV pilus assembly protein PilO|nr:type 4a pilus biogenesis protein PilO [Rhodocyclaceae bacterium]
MKFGKGSSERKSIDFQQLAADFQGLDPNDPGQWPIAPRIAVFIGLLAAAVAAFWWFDWRDQITQLERVRSEEQQLRTDWTSKKRLAVNLDQYRRQLDEIDRQFGTLLKQLPNRAEMDSLLAEINQAGLGRGLQFELFKPGPDQVKDFYAEMPIDVTILGEYHDLGAFASDVAKMPRIVTLNNIAMENQQDGGLKFTAKAVTYRYLDEDELAARRQASDAQQGQRRR